MGATFMNSFRLAALAVTHPVITTRAIFRGGFSQGLGNIVVGAAAELAGERGYLMSGLTEPSDTGPFLKALAPLKIDAARVSLGVARSWLGVPPESWVRSPLVQWLKTAPVDQAAAVLHQLDLDYAQRVLARLPIDRVAAFLNSDKISSKKAAAILDAGCKWKREGARDILQDGKWAVAVLSSEQMRADRAAAILSPGTGRWFTADQDGALWAHLPAARRVAIINSPNITSHQATQILYASCAWVLDGSRSLSSQTSAVMALEAEETSLARAAEILCPVPPGWFPERQSDMLWTALSPKRAAAILDTMRPEDVAAILGRRCGWRQRGGIRPSLGDGSWAVGVLAEMRVAQANAVLNPVTGWFSRPQIDELLAKLSPARRAAIESFPS